MDPVLGMYTCKLFPQLASYMSIVLEAAMSMMTSWLTVTSFFMHTSVHGTTMDCSKGSWGSHDAGPTTLMS